jgi:aryl-alcohol dehydrogenase-like predicted oxidoreductase
MQYCHLGSAGVRVSVIGLGTNRFGTDVTTQEVVNNIIAACAEQGINLSTRRMFIKEDVRKRDWVSR